MKKAESHKYKKMLPKILKFSLLFLVNIIFVFNVQSQDIESCAYVDQIERPEPLPESARERLMTLCIEENKKQFEELIKRTEDVARLSKEIETSFTENNKLSDEDKDKLKEVEKLLNKIRKELKVSDDGDKDDGDEEEKPKTTLQAIKYLQENSSKLLEEIKQITRYTISAAAVQSTNAVMKIVKFLRFKN